MTKPLSRIRNLQGLRLYAAIPVVLYHTKFNLPGIRPIGIFGVHLFFLLSGYIMASICDGDSTAFAKRRLIRIVPLYWTLTLMLYLVAWKFPHLMNATRALPSELVKSLLFVPFAKSNGLYQPILFVGWTVNCEMFFYMMLSLAVLIHRRRAALVGAAIMLSVMGFCSILSSESAIAKFYSNSVLLECLLGLLSYYCVRYATQWLTPAMKPALLTAALGTMVLLPAIEEWQMFYHLPAVVRYGPLCFVLICSVCLLASLGADIKPGAIVLLGDASYVMYLTHPYVIQFLDRVIGRFIPIFRVDAPVGCLVAMVFVMPISAFLYLKIDKPVVGYLNNVLCKRKRTDPAMQVAPPLARNTVESAVAHATPLLGQASAS
jgi:exopolysaccharide production protein ExoZ